MPVRPSNERLAVLANAGIAISRGLELEETLQTIVDAACHVTDARFAALGVLGPDLRISRFITAGLDADAVAAIGDYPTGRGILGVLIDERRPVRLRDLAADPRAVGFPPNHPPMHSFLGVPVEARGAVFGNLYLTESPDGEFTAEDERIVVLLAAQAGVAIENARLYAEAQGAAAEARRSAKARAAVAMIAASILRERDVERLLTALATEARDLVGARVVAVGVPDEQNGTLRFRVAVGEGAERIRGVAMPIEGSVSGTVLQAGVAARLDAAATLAAGHAETMRVTGTRTLLVVPMLAGDDAVAVLTAIDAATPDGFGSDDQEALEALAALGAVALETARAFGRERARSVALARLRTVEAESSLARVTEAQERERRRIAQDLHDRTAGDLAAIQIGLKRVERAGGREALERGVRDARADLAAVIEDLRDLIVDLRPKVLDDFGLAPALERLCEAVARRSGLAIYAASGPEVAGLPPVLATAAYRIVQEALTNTVRHAAASRASVTASFEEELLVVVIEDDGDGIDASALAGYGIEGMQERAALVAGRLTLETPTGGGTRVIFEVPR